MGEANRRGTFEERKAQSIAKREAESWERYEHIVRRERAERVSNVCTPGDRGRSAILLTAAMLTSSTVLTHE